jgi:PAS domain S-box-containing protein
MPALAVVNADHRIIRSTETFRQRYDAAGKLCARSPELELVLTGRANTAVMNAGDFSVAIEAVMDAAGKRQAMLSVAPEEQPPPEPPIEALREAVDESPAIVWVKDIDGRYLHVNSRYTADLGTPEEKLRGHTDAELRPVETVDGPRLKYADDGLKEPLQLEYIVPAFDGRPALTALRFALRDDNGQPIGTCGVAAPVTEAHVARDEAVRLMQLERWNRLDPRDVRAELLEQWHVQAAPPRRDDPELEDRVPEDSVSTAAEPMEVQSPPEPAEAEAPVEEEAEEEEEEEAQPAPVVEEADQPADDEPVDEEPPREEEWVRQLRQSARISTEEAADTAEALQAELGLAREWAERANLLQGDLHDAHARLREVEAELQQSVAAVLRGNEEASRLRTELQEAQGANDETIRLRAELEQARVELERAQAESERALAESERALAESELAQADAHAARAEAEMARGELGAARAQTEALRGPSAVALRLSEELGRALAAERERGDELSHTLARVRARLADLDSALELNQPGQVQVF